MKEEILRLLRSADGYISGQELCNRFGVSRTAVWKAINQLKEAGYEIEAQQNKGYRLMAAPDLMTEAEIKSLMHTEWVAKEVLYFDTIDSTNTKAQELAEKGYPSGTLVVADKQESGKGRRGRSWVSPSGTGIFMTLMIKPDINPNNASMLTLVAALAVAKAITSVTGEEALIKWPNDIVVNGKKVCGILTEMNAQFDYINHIVVGIGINVHNESFPEEISQMASSLMIEAGGKRFHRAQIIAETMSYFEQYYDTFLKTQDLSALVREYDKLLVNRNKSVRVLDPKEPFDGKAMGITPKGELIVDTWESRKLVSSGEVSVRGIYGYV
uniref:biotin--[acetyl-CoA-carboxylase] ligase n=1 Tax=Agathobacter rectalis TaxID=39491 RepID=UPI00402A2DB3